MRRMVLCAAFILVLALPLCRAQRGRGGAAPAARMGFSSRSAVSSLHVSSPHAPSLRSSFWAGAHPPPHFGTSPYFARHYSSHLSVYTYPWWYGRYYGYPWYYGGYYPLFWSDSAYDDSAQRDYQQQVMRQIDDLGQEVERLREERETAELQPPPAPAPQNRSENPTKSDLPTILVYPDKHIEEVKNYAIVGDTFWVLGDHMKKIPLMDIDLAATSKLNDERGVYFEVPGRAPSQ